MAKDDLARTLVNDRWRQATTRPVRFEGERGFSGGNSKAWERILYDLEELGARLVDGCDLSNGAYDRLETVVWTDLTTLIEERLTAWAVEVETEGRYPAPVSAA